MLFGNRRSIHRLEIILGILQNAANATDFPGFLWNISLGGMEQESVKYSQSKYKKSLQSCNSRMKIFCTIQIYGKCRNTAYLEKLLQSCRYWMYKSHNFLWKFLWWLLKIYRILLQFKCESFYCLLWNNCQRIYLIFSSTHGSSFRKLAFMN